MEENKPVYPRPNPEYDKAVYEQFLNRMKNMKWIDPDECQRKSRGRKPKQYHPPQYDKSKARNRYNWFD